MFITCKSGYNRYGQQIAKGQFLIMLCKNVFPSTGKPVEYRALTRKVYMSQFGHFMMADINVCGTKIVLSGSYGSDGLPISVDENPRYNKGDKLAALELLWQLAEPVPAELIQKWSKGGGHNGAGSESKDFRNWGKTLKQPIFKKKQFLELKEKFSLLSACQ